MCVEAVSVAFDIPHANFAIVQYVEWTVSGQRARRSDLQSAAGKLDLRQRRRLRRGRTDTSPHGTYGKTGKPGGEKNPNHPYYARQAVVRDANGDFHIGAADAPGSTTIPRDGGAIYAGVFRRAGTDGDGSRRRDCDRTWSSRSSSTGIS